MENPQAMPQHLGSFNKRGDCIFLEQWMEKKLHLYFRMNL